MTLFQARLHACMKEGSLSLGDLHHWFDRPRPTVRFWAHTENRLFEPWKDPRGKEAWVRLRLLEWAIRNKKGFPVPTTLTASQRPQHILKTYADVRARVSESYTSRDRFKNVLHDSPEAR